MSLHNRLPQRRTATVMGTAEQNEPVPITTPTNPAGRPAPLTPALLPAVRPMRCRECDELIPCGGETIASQHRVCWESNFCWEWRRDQWRAESEQRKTAQQSYQHAREQQRQTGHQTGQWQERSNAQ